MKKQILYVALDVDDKAYHATLVTEHADVATFRCEPNVKVLKKNLAPFQKQYEIQICYEAGFLGFTLCRNLREIGYRCDVVAPSLIPEMAGKRVKTDRIDSRDLANFYRKGLLTFVRVPELEEEIDRDLLRSRDFLAGQIKSLKARIISICRKAGLEYRQDTDRKAYWSGYHMQWLHGRLNETESRIFKMHLTLLLEQLQQMQETQRRYDELIEEMAGDEKYQKSVKALNCFRGIDTLSSMTLITEIGDIRRFKHPKQLVLYSGLDISEYSSGGKHRRFKITKMGNVNIRTRVIESSQFAFKAPYLSRRLVERRKGADPAMVAIADRCMKRLHKKTNRMLHAGKHRNKAVVAAGREMLGFVWEALVKAA